MRMPSAALIAAHVAAALVSGYAASRFLPALDDPDPPLAARRPVEGSPGPRRARRLVLVVVDGLRLDVSEELPFLGRLRRGGAGGRARASFPTLSAPGYTAILTGVEPRFSGVRTNQSPTPRRLDSVPARAHAAGMRVAYRADGRGVVPALFAGQIDSAATDGVDPRLPDAELVILVFTEVDRAGHRYGGSSPEYRESARAVDRKLEQVVGGLDLARDAVVVTSDHGHEDRGGHGGAGPLVQNVPVVMAGAGVRVGAVLPDAPLEGLAPSLAALLGLPAPGHAAGALEPVRQAIERDAWARHRAALRWRVPLAALALAAGFLALGRAGVWRWRRLLPVLGSPLVFYGLVISARSGGAGGVAGDTASLGQELLPVGALAAVVQIALQLLAASRSAVAGRASSALGLWIVGGVALGAWALAGETLADTLPGPDLVMLPPIAYAALTFHSIVGCAMLAIQSRRP